MSRRGKAVAAIGTVGVAAAAAVAVVNLPDAEGGGAPRNAMPPATAEVTRQTLVDTATRNGELGYGEATAQHSRSAGTVTGLPGTGATVTRGKALYRIDDDPVVLLYGKLPAYRTLVPGTEGRDVAQFEKNLWALGYRGFTVDDTYTEATADAVRDWQDDLGVPETGTLDPARVVHAPHAVRVDSRRVAVGDVARPGTELLTTTGTSRVATVGLDVADQRLAKVGAKVTVTLPDGSTAPGTIADAETVVEAATEPGGEDTTTVQVTVTFTGGRKPSGLDAASVDVAFTAAERRNVLTVPVAALLALAEGGYGVQVVDGGTTRLVAVETGLFADGRVEVSGGGLAAGMRVGVPS
ncbi:peptidoglycan-binding protein [Jidongwangia harbinensis]|uniref:peptidoglycan-binding protein n=1 Tax=Jidongwangia harbinensis TaxID=2878561 RepID=UPI001CD9D148|nr:peptidoglycan-binding protein [Jidongwangia harbinensis]MCA2216787.1 peptidoglycan-binding protein [Jidongwangia harbinensis]